MKKGIVLVIIVGLLFFGCINILGSKLDTFNINTLINASVPTTEGSQGQDQTGKDNEGGSDDKQSDGQIDYSKMTYEQLITLGSPLKCDVINADGTTSIMYLKGGNIRIETVLDPEQDHSFHCKTLVQLVNNEPKQSAQLYYNAFGCKEGSKIMPQVLPDCDWYAMMIVPAMTGGSQTYPTGVGPSGGVDTTVLKQLPAGSFSCTPTTIQDEMFKIPESANICTIDDLMALGNTP